MKPNAAPVLARLGAGARSGLLAAALATALIGTAAAQATDPRLAAIEQLQRAQPAEALVQLGALEKTLPASSPQRVLALAMRGALQADRNDMDGAELTLRELESLQPHERSARSAAELVRGVMLGKRGLLRRAERQYADALDHLPDDALPALRMRVMRALAALKEGQGQFDEALRLRHQLIVLSDTHGPDWRKGEARAMLGNTLMWAHQIEPASKALEEALAMARQQGDLIGEERALNSMAILYSERGESAKELETMKRVIELARKAGSREDEALGLSNLSDHYLKAGEYETAIEIARQALPLARELGYDSSESVALANIGLALIATHRLAEGLDYARQSIAIDERSGALADSVRFQEELGTYLERAGYLAEAVKAYQRYRRLSDELFGQDQQRAVLELQEGFENDRRERDLELLRRENNLKQVQLLNAELQQRVWVAAAAVGVLLLALAGVLLHRLRRAGLQLSEGNALLQTQSERDPLTNLANRRYLQRVMQPADGGEPQPFEGSLLLIDLDHFKHINDRHGHAAGDAVLVELARRLQSTLRDDDLVIRWGGEEFLVVARELTQDQVQALAQRLLTAIGSQPVTLPDGSALPVSASIGYASFPTEPTRLAVNWERALDLVDTALYLAKAHGRNLAYGVRLLHARDESELVQISRGLEAAWSEGRVKLTPLHGPEQATQAAGREEPVA